MLSSIKVFRQRELSAALTNARAGGQSLHICSTAAFVGRTAPACFKRSHNFAHLFDQDRPRLIRTARRFGVRVIKIGRSGTDRQHIDLCGKPLDRAITSSLSFGSNPT